MKSVEGENYFSDVEARLALPEAFPLVQVSEEFTSVHVICKYTKLQMQNQEHIFYSSSLFLPRALLT